MLNWSVIETFLDFDVALWRWIFSQVLGVISIVLMFIAFQTKTKKLILFLFTIGIACGVVATAMLGNWVLMGLLALSLVRNIVFLIMDKHQEKISRPLSISVLFIFLIAKIIFVSFTFEWWLDWLLLAVSLFSTYGKWQKGTHLIRISSITFSALAIVNHVFFSNLTGIAIDIVIITSIIIFYVRFFIKHKRSKENNQIIEDQPSIDESSETIEPTTE